MLSNNSNENKLVQESIIPKNEEKDLNKDQTNKKSKTIELTNINDEEDTEHMSFLNTNEEIKLNTYEEIKVNKIDIKRIIIRLFPFIYDFLLYLFYLLSLEGCFLSQVECIPLLSSMFLVRLVIFGFLAALMTVIQIYLVIYKKFKCYHLLFTAIFYIIMYYYDHGTRLDYHGIYNLIAISFIILVLLLLIGLAIIIINSIRKKKKIPIIIIVSLILYVVIRLFLFFNSMKDSCQPWNKGLNSTIMDNSPDFECDVVYPEKCLLYKINTFFDLSSYVKSCSPDYDHEEDNKHLIRYLKIDKSLMDLSDKTHFGYPITVNNPLFNKNNPEEYYNVGSYVMKNIILMDLYNHVNKKYYNESYLRPEVEVIYDKKTKKRKIEINVIKNETLAKERKEIETDPNNKNTSIYKNIMIIYIDCISRQHFLRVMKKTSSFIEKFMKYNNNLGLSSYEFMKYQAFCHWTNPNVVPMFYSSYIDSYTVNIVKYLKENGYVTAQSQNMCSKESFEYDPQYIEENYLELDEFDHENIAMFCDPNYEEIDNKSPITTGPYGILRRCITGKDSFEYMIEYGKQFWKKYKDNKKYLRLIFQDAHEFTGQVVKYLDEPLYNFLNDLYKNKELENTALFFICDHGNSYFNYFYYYILKSDDSLIERGYASLYIILPNFKENKNEEYLNNIKERQQSYITPFDIHDTLLHISYGNNLDFDSILYSHHGNSLITNFEYKSRKCKEWEDFFQRPDECICKNGFD